MDILSALELEVHDTVIATRDQTPVVVRATSRDEWQFLRLLAKAHFPLAASWWLLIVARGVLPALFAIAMGVLVGAVHAGSSVYIPLAMLGTFFVLVQILTPLHLAVSKNLGDRTASLLHDRLSETCVEPQGMGHLEDPKSTNDLAMARDFDLGISGPPLSVSMDMVAAGLVELFAGLTASIFLFAYAWWAPLVLGGAWIATHFLLKESAVWMDRNTDEVRNAQRHADYAYRIAVGPPAAKELRLFALSSWVVDRFRTMRRQLHDLRWEATRLREKSVFLSLALVTAANLVVFSSMAMDVTNGILPLDRMVIYASLAFTSSMIAFGGLSWALDSASAPAGAVLRLKSTMQQVGSLIEGSIATPPQGARDVRLRNLSFAYPATGELVLKDFDLFIPAGSSIAIVGQNGAGKTTLAKLLCRLYDPQRGSIEFGGVDIRNYSLAGWRKKLASVFQDFVRYEFPLRDNVDPTRTASEEQILTALKQAGAEGIADLDAVMNRAYVDGIELSGGQWQRVALARALCGVYLGAGIVILDEPTAQLDVRGEAEIFANILRETRQITTILISHRFSTVRHVDKIFVLEKGHVIEQGSHDELIARGGRYKTMFEMQSARFDENSEDLEALDAVH